MGKDRKKIILIVLLCVFGAALAYRITHPYRQKSVEKLTFTGIPQEAPSKAKKSQNAKTSFTNGDVRLDLFTKPPTHSSSVLKNIFFYEKPAEQAKDVSEQENESLPGSIEKPVPIEVTKRLQVQEELSHFQSFGYIEDTEGITLFLERGKQILVVRKGDRINGKYVVKDITTNELTLTAMDINEDVHIDLSQLE